jgi:hypothetical protein
VPMSAKAAGLGYAELCVHILEHAALDAMPKTSTSTSVSLAAGPSPAPSGSEA